MTDFELSALALFVLVLCLFLVGYFRAMAPRSGTLEWIARRDLPPLRLSGTCRHMNVRTLLYAAVCFLIGGASGFLQTPGDSTAILYRAVTIGLLGTLLLLLTPSVEAAACGGLILLASPDASLSSGLFALFLLLFFCFMTEDAARFLLRGACLFCALFSLFCCCLLNHASFWALPGFLLLFLLTILLRLVRRESRPLKAVLSLLFYLAAPVLALFAAFAVFYGVSTAVQLFCVPRQLLSELLALPGTLPVRSSFPAGSTALLFAGVLFSLCAVIQAFRLKCGMGLAAAGLFLISASVWVFSDTQTPGAVFPAVFLFSGLLSRKKYALPFVMTAALIVCSLLPMLLNAFSL